jgi:hypothetical protein
VTVGSILIYVALIAYIGYRRVQGQPVKASRQLLDEDNNRLLPYEL